MGFNVSDGLKFVVNICIVLFCRSCWMGNLEVVVVVRVIKDCV